MSGGFTPRQPHTVIVGHLMAGRDSCLKIEFVTLLTYEDNK